MLLFVTRYAPPSAVLDAGIGAADLMNRLGAVDARDAPVTRDILQAIADMQGERS